MQNNNPYHTIKNSGSKGWYDIVTSIYDIDDTLPFVEVNKIICDKFGIEFNEVLLLSEMIDRVNIILIRDLKINKILNG